MFVNLHRRLGKHGSFNESKGGFSRHKELPDAVQENVLQYFRDNPHANTRAAARDLGIRNHVAVWHVLEDNHLHPYHFQKVQDLLPP